MKSCFGDDKEFVCDFARCIKQFIPVGFNKKPMLQNLNHPDNGEYERNTAESEVN